MKIDTTQATITAVHVRLSQVIVMASNDYQSTAKAKSLNGILCLWMQSRTQKKLIDALDDARYGALREFYDSVQEFARAKETWLIEKDNLLMRAEATEEKLAVFTAQPCPTCGWKVRPIMLAEPFTVEEDDGA